MCDQKFGMKEFVDLMLVVTVPLSEADLSIR